MEEFETLSDAEKALSIRSKIKNIQHQKYNVELDILAESAVSNPDSNRIAEWQIQLSDLGLRETALQEELASLVP